MSSPQDGPTRHRIKARRAKKLAKWREKQATKPQAASTQAKKK